MAAKTSTCKYCGCAIVWMELSTGWRPYNAVTGQPHFDECQHKPDGSQYSKKRNRKAKRHARRKQATTPVVKPVKAADHEFRECSCNIPPWEVCEHSFPEFKDGKMPISL